MFSCLINCGDWQFYNIPSLNYQRLGQKLIEFHTTLAVMFQICERHAVIYLSFLSLSIHLTSGLKATFDPSSITINTANYRNVKLELSDLRDYEILKVNDKSYLSLQSSDEKVARVENRDKIIFVKSPNQESWEADFNVSGVFMGSSEIFVMLNLGGNESNFLENSLSVTVIRQKIFIDDLFLYSTVIFLTVVNVNFGAALNMSNLKEILKSPIGPAICCVGQFVFMPLIAFGIGSLIFDDMELGHAFALGLFFCGVSPGGGFSNIWSLLLGGNVDLSVAMTLISTVAAFGMIPFWVFTLGKVFFDRANLGIPYTNVITSAAGLIIPLTIGVLIRKFKPNVGNFLVRILKPLSTILIVIMVTSAIISNFYMWQLFTWQVSHISHYFIVIVIWQVEKFTNFYIYIEDSKSWVIIAVDGLCFWMDRNKNVLSNSNGRDNSFD